MYGHDRAWSSRLGAFESSFLCARCHLSVLQRQFGVIVLENYGTALYPFVMITVPYHPPGSDLLQQTCLFPFHFTAETSGPTRCLC